MAPDRQLTIDQGNYDYTEMFWIKKRCDSNMVRLMRTLKRSTVSDRGREQARQDANTREERRGRENTRVRVWTPNFIVCLWRNMCLWKSLDPSELKCVRICKFKAIVYYMELMNVLIWIYVVHWIRSSVNCVRWYNVKGEASITRLHEYSCD